MDSHLEGRSHAALEVSGNEENIDCQPDEHGAEVHLVCDVVNKVDHLREDKVDDQVDVDVVREQRQQDADAKQLVQIVYGVAQAASTESQPLEQKQRVAVLLHPLLRKTHPHARQLCVYFLERRSEHLGEISLE